MVVAEQYGELVLCYLTGQFAQAVVRQLVTASRQEVFGHQRYKNKISPVSNVCTVKPNVKAAMIEAFIFGAPTLI